MLLACLKIGDVAFRSFFLLFVLYALPERGSGQFGLIVTLVAFVCFFCGYERYIDIQRKLTGLEATEGDRLIISSIKFFTVNFMLVSLLVVSLLVYWIEVGLPLAGLVLLITFSEHISNEVYRYSLVAPRYTVLIWISLLKNISLMAFTLLIELLESGNLSLEEIIYVWVCVSILHLLVTLVFFKSKISPGFKEKLIPFGSELLVQFRASRVHFFIGLLAWFFLQGDRFIVGSILTLEQTGVYFRHVFLAAALYQVAIIIFFNRIIHRVYSGVRNNRLADAQNLVKKQYKIIVPLGVMAVISVFGLKLDLPIGPEIIGSLVPEVLALLISAYVIRILADYNTMFFKRVLQ